MVAAFAVTAGALPATAADPDGDSDGDRAIVEDHLPASPADPDRPIDDPALRAELAALRAPRPAERSAPTMIAVEILHDGADDAIRDLVAAAGGTVTGAAPGTVAQALLPPDRIADVATSAGVAYVRSPRDIASRPLELPGGQARAASPPGSDPSTAVNADAWHTAGFTGAGVRVGILDFFNWAIEDVPRVTEMLCLDGGAPCDVRSGGSAHGVAVAEIIHDIAPSADLYAAQAGTISDLYAVIDWFASRGVRVVNSSLGFSYDGPGDGTGPLADAVSYAASKGITWFNAIGNEGSTSYWRTVVGPDSFDASGYLRFPDGETAMSLNPPQDSGSCGGGYLTWILAGRWNDWGPPATRTNYDYEIWEGGARLFPGGPGVNQQAGAPPVELDNVGGCSTTPNVSLRIRRLEMGSGSIGDVLELQVYQGSLEFWQTPYSGANPIADSRDPAVVAVGAVDDDSRTVAYYSSQGPTNDQRVKPDLSAVACLHAEFYPGAACFDGTSAATPVAAGTAALYLGANLAAGPRELAAVTKHYTVDRGDPGADIAYGVGEISMPPPPSGAVNTNAAAYTPISPIRLLDSRLSSPIGPPGVPLGSYPPGTIIDVPVAGPGLPAPTGATAVAINVTDTGSHQPGYIQAFPTLRAPVGGASTLNMSSVGQVLPNFTLVPIGQDGKISVYTDAGGSLLIDVFGYFVPAASASAGRYQPMTPRRVLDTRQTDPAVLPDGWAPHEPGAGEVVTVPLRPGSGVPSTGVSAVIVNVTGVEPTLPGYVTAWSGFGAPPNVSTLNMAPGAEVANTAIVPINPGGPSIALYTERGAHLIVDVVGYITDANAPVGTAGRFVPLGPNRVFDTRLASALADRSTVLLNVAGVAGIPASGAVAVSFNVTATQQQHAGGYLTLVPGDVDPAAAYVSNVNWSTPGSDIANGAIVPLAATAHPGSVALFAWSATHAIIDVNGYFTG